MKFALRRGGGCLIDLAYTCVGMVERVVRALENAGESEQAQSNIGMARTTNAPPRHRVAMIAA
jgi:hypothetical protein